MNCTVFERLRLNSIISEALNKKGQAAHLCMHMYACEIQESESQEIKMKLHWPCLVLFSSLAHG